MTRRAPAARQPARGELLIELLLVVAEHPPEQLCLNAGAVDDAVIRDRRVEGVAETNGQVSLLVEKIARDDEYLNVRAAQLVPDRKPGHVLIALTAREA